MDGLEQEVGRIPPSVNISDDLSEFTINWVWIIFQEMTLPSDPLMVGWWMVDSGWEGLAVLDGILDVIIGKVGSFDNQIEKMVKTGQTNINLLINVVLPWYKIYCSSESQPDMS